MNTSLERLRELTTIVFDKQIVDITEIATTDEYGEKIFIIQTVDQKLGEAKLLIKDAQEALSVVKDDVKNNEEEAAIAVKLAATALVISDGKDERIKKLILELKKSVADLKAAHAEIDRIKENGV